MNPANKTSVVSVKKLKVYYTVCRRRKLLWLNFRVNFGHVTNLLPLQKLANPPSLPSKPLEQNL